MVSLNDTLLFAAFLFISAGMVYGVAGIGLPGSTGDAVKDIISGPSVEPEDRYRLESCITFNGEVESLPDPNTQLIYEDSFKYRTFEADGLLSFTSPSLSLAGTKDTEIEYILRKDGEVVASGSKYAGEVGSNEEKNVCFETNNLKSGSYSVEMILSGTGFGIFGETGEKSDSVRKTVEVPKVPLGEY